MASAMRALAALDVTCDDVAGTAQQSHEVAKEVNTDRTERPEMDSHIE
ncbi:MAG: hypothetical protein U5K38_01100 [Woeseiaceae bacterium]|nr:hypothetical protein [Woeseiaceae bacterium]